MDTAEQPDHLVNIGVFTIPLPEMIKTVFALFVQQIGYTKGIELIDNSMLNKHEMIGANWRISTNTAAILTLKVRLESVHSAS
jgi:hypothetical protein